MVIVNGEEFPKMKHQSNQIISGVESNQRGHPKHQLISKI